MPQKLTPIDELIANPPPAREKLRPAEREKIEPTPPPKPAPKDKR